MSFSRSGPLVNGPRARGSGFVLVTVLVLLVAAMLLSTLAFTQARGQERISANQRARLMAYAGAEAASRAAESFLHDFALTAGGASLVSNAASGGSIYGRDEALVSSNYQQFVQPRTWATNGAKVVGGTSFTDGELTARLSAQPVYVIEDMGRFRPPGAGVVAEGGTSGNAGYEGSGGMSPAGNSDLRVFRTIGKAAGPGADPNTSFVVTVWSIYAGRTQG